MRTFHSSLLHAATTRDCIVCPLISSSAVFAAITAISLAATNASAQATRHQVFNRNTTGVNDVGVRYFAASYGVGYLAPEPPWTGLSTDGQSLLLTDDYWFSTFVPKPGGGRWDYLPEIRFPFVGSGLDVIHLRDDAGEVFDWEIVDTGASNSFNVVASGTVDTYTAGPAFQETISLAPQGSLSSDRIYMLRLNIRDTDDTTVRRRIFIDAFDVYDEVPLNYDDDSNFSGNWTFSNPELWELGFSDNEAYEGTRSSTFVAGETIEYDFVGTSLVVAGFGWAGISASYDWEIDGGLQSGTVDQSLDVDFAHRWPELLINGLSSGPHTLKITVNGENTGTYSPNAGYTFIDAIAVFDSGIVIEGVDGDYNGDLVVDAADYVVWRDRLGSNFSLPGENPNASTPGVVDQEDYDFWKSRFGATSGSGSLVAVPEPSTLMLLAIAAIFATRVPALRCRNKDS